MAAIVDPDGQLDLETLAQGLKSSLPVYARPLFIRVCSDIPATGTFFAICLVDLFVIKLCMFITCKIVLGNLSVMHSLFHLLCSPSVTPISSKPHHSSKGSVRRKESAGAYDFRDEMS